jgi:hypothetical protein
MKTLYHVHIYREMRLYFPGIEADSPEHAARIAREKPTHDAEYTEDCDGQNLSALVDVAGDSVFEHSVTIDFGSDPALPVRFDGYEIHGIFRMSDDDGRSFCEQVPEGEAQFWSFFGHIPGQGLDCIGDFQTRDHAEEVFARITGRRYTDTTNAG